MKANPQSAAKIRSIIRWTTGTATTAAIMVAGSMFFPLLGSFTAFSLTLCFAIYIGLQIALPPLDEEDDWVPVRAMLAEEYESATEPQNDSSVIAFPARIRPAV